MFAGASGKVACCDGLWWSTVWLFMELVVEWHCYNRILRALLLMHNYVYITIMSDVTGMICTEFLRTQALCAHMCQTSS